MKQVPPLRDQAAIKAPAPARRRISVTAVRVLLINTVFGVLIAVALYATVERTALFRMMGFAGAGGISGIGHSAERQGAAGKHNPLLGAASLAPDDPVLRFAETRVGQLLFTSMRSDDCQRVLFDNRTGASYDAPGVFCGQSADQVVEADGPARLNAVRASFQR
jgi:hypothetical protein